MKIVKISDFNSNTFNDINHEDATILFYHPSCIHCVMMRENWEKAKQQVQRSKKPCNIYEVNGEHLNNIDHPLKGEIQGFPTIMNAHNGKLKEYFEKERNIDNMVKFILSNTPRHQLANRSQKNLNSRGVSFSKTRNGNLVKTVKLLNKSKLSNSNSRKKRFQNLKNSFDVALKKHMKRRKTQQKRGRRRRRHGRKGLTRKR
jgi:hypothetical protein